MTEKKECFWCKRKYFVDDPEFDSGKTNLQFLRRRIGTG